jgi:hypothetical protein
LETPNTTVRSVEEAICDELAKTVESRKRRAFKKFAMAALGSIPWVGAFVQAAAEFVDSERGQVRVNALYQQWFEEHSGQMKRLAATLADILARVEQLGDEVADRLESDSYLALARQGFRAWDEAETDEKRELIRLLLTNAAGTKLCTDDLVRLFISWIRTFHESHFKVIRVIHKNPGATRAEIWQEIYGEFPREDSAEADLFKLLIHDLTLGHVIRQERETTTDGRFVRKPRPVRRGPALTTMKSTFDDGAGYELTGLGEQFVHYTMNELVPRIGK